MPTSSPRALRKLDLACGASEKNTAILPYSAPVCRFCFVPLLCPYSLAEFMPNENSIHTCATPANNAYIMQQIIIGPGCLIFDCMS